MILVTGANGFVGTALCRYLFYNQRRPHTALDGQTPDMVYCTPLPQPQAA